jgi:hypothetical protein
MEYRGKNKVGREPYHAILGTALDFYDKNKSVFIIEIQGEKI